MTGDPLLDAIGPYTVVDRLRLQSLQGLLADRLTEGIAGDVVECGTASGGSAAVLAAGLVGTTRHLWCYDTFTGLPAPTAIDGPFAPPYTGANATTIDRVCEALALSGLPTTQIHLRRGLFAESFPAGGPSMISLLHIDADWYESVRICLQQWYDRVSPFGVIVLDDYGFWRGCRLALYDFCAQRRIAPALVRVGEEQAYWIKTE